MFRSRIQDEDNLSVFEVQFLQNFAIFFLCPFRMLITDYKVDRLLMGYSFVFQMIRMTLSLITKVFFFVCYTVLMLLSLDEIALK